MSNRKVSKEEFEAFEKNFPRLLERNVSGICEPPLLTLNDFSDRKVWPESIVAGIHLYESFPKDGQEPYKWSPNEYFIRENDGW